VRRERSSFPWQDVRYSPQRNCPEGGHLYEATNPQGRRQLRASKKDAIMAQTAQIRCINKQPRNDPYHRITHVGGFGTSHWKLPVDDAIGMIERGEWQFYVAHPSGGIVGVVVASKNGHKYLKTIADGDTPDNLLSLPECP
jgi:hypothetical protein